MEKKEDSRERTHVIIHPNILPTTRSQRAADALTKWVGSWTFIVIFIFFLLLWIIANTFWFLFGTTWDPHPFVLLNLVLAVITSVQAPIILMSQNRENQKDRQRAEYDYLVNRKAEREIEQVQDQLRRIEKKLNERG
jgi:uncharacterized membrane protein